VNNAGLITKPARLHEMSLEDWNQVISVNLTGVFLCMQREIDVMLKQGNGGSIINISSILGLVGLDPGLKPRVNYIASKHGWWASRDKERLSTPSTGSESMPLLRAILQAPP